MSMHPMVNRMTSKPEMRIFKVANTTQHVRTIIAGNQEAAKKIAFKIGHVRDESCITAVVDVTSDLKDRHNISEILEKRKTGYIDAGRSCHSNYDHASACILAINAISKPRFRLKRVDP